MTKPTTMEIETINAPAAPAISPAGPSCLAVSEKVVIPMSTPNAISPLTKNGRNQTSHERILELNILPSHPRNKVYETCIFKSPHQRHGGNALSDGLRLLYGARLGASLFTGKNGGSFFQECPRTLDTVLRILCQGELVHVSMG